MLVKGATGGKLHKAMYIFRAHRPHKIPYVDQRADVVVYPVDVVS